MALIEFPTEWGLRSIKRLGFRTWLGAKISSSSALEEIVVVKVGFKTGLPPDIPICRVNRGIRIISLLEHEHIVKMLEVHENPKVICVVMGHMKHDLRDYLKKNNPLPEETAKSLFLQLTKAVDYMHNTAKIAHGDIHCSNIFLDRGLNVKLAGFYTCEPLENDSVLNEDCISSREELVAYDVYKLGLVLYFMLKERNTSFKGDLEKLPVDPGCIELLKLLLREQPPELFTTQGILQHEWLN